MTKSIIMAELRESIKPGLLEAHPGFTNGKFNSTSAGENSRDSAYIFRSVFITSNYSPYFFNTNIFTGNFLAKQFTRYSTEKTNLKYSWNKSIFAVREPPKVWLVKQLTEVCIGGWNSMCQPYIESATALSDEESREFLFLSGFGKALQRLTGPINVILT